MSQALSPTTSLLIFLIALIVLLAKGMYVLREYERAVIFRFGRLARGLIGGIGPGVIIIIPLVDKLVRV
ncbi:MAG: slipin family protein, partial [Nitrospinae bacterium]|nr:slipin family protein [Nitrospinota bacterium]